MKSNANFGQVSFRLVEALICLLKAKDVLSTNETVAIFEVAAHSFHVGSKEYELLQEMLLQFDEMPPDDKTGP